jgi:hypothetical protein
MEGMMRVGYWSTLGAIITSIGYAVPQVLQVLGILPDPIDRILIFAPSLLLAPCFVVSMASAYGVASPEDRPLRLAALCFAVLYGGLASIVYINQLGVVIPRELAGDAQGYARLACCEFREPLTVIDLLGYTYMSIATLLLAPTYRGHLRTALVVNGVLAAPIILQLFWPALIWVGALWLVTFPVAMILLLRTFAETAPGAST